MMKNGFHENWDMTVRLSKFDCCNQFTVCRGFDKWRVVEVVNQAGK